MKKYTNNDFDQQTQRLFESAWDWQKRGAETILEKLNQSELIYKGQLNAPKDYTGTQKDNDLTIFKSTLFNDDEDRALTKNDGSPTYFANDIAYHEDK